jgi:hypothetical protein
VLQSRIAAQAQIADLPLDHRAATFASAVVNLLLLGYVLPAVLMLLLSYAVARHRSTAYANSLAAARRCLGLPM